MKKRKPPELIDLPSLAARRQSLHGSYPLADLPRIDRDMIPQAGAMVTFSLDFAPGRMGGVQVHGEIGFSCQLLCVRCMQAFRHTVKQAIHWQTAADWRQAQQLPQGVEPLPDTDKAVKLRDLLEDEVLLCIPDSPRHTEICPLPTQNKV